MQSDSLLVPRSNAKKGTAISYIEVVSQKYHDMRFKRFESLYAVGLVVSSTQ